MAFFAMQAAKIATFFRLVGKTYPDQNGKGLKCKPLGQDPYVFILLIKGSTFPFRYITIP